MLTDLSTWTPNRRELLGLAGVTVFAPGLLAGCGSNPLDYAATIADARQAIAAEMEATDTPSVSVAMMDRDRVLWTEAFGVIDKAAGLRPTTDTLFNIGSCTKVFATAAVMILVERGQVELDAPLLRYLPAFRMASPEYALVTVRMLLDHASGFPGSDNRNQGGARPFAGYAAQVMHTLSRSRLKHLPGEMSVYCNDGFTMIEPLVEAVSGKRFVQFVADELLGPLDMTLSRFALVPYPGGSFAPGYAGDVKLGQEFMNAYATGGLSSTPSEVGNFAIMLLNEGLFRGRRILQASSVREMGRNQNVNEPLRPVDSDFFGLGWDGVQEAGLAAVGVRAWHKSGGTNIYGSQLVVLPDEGLAVMITGTSRSYAALALCERILLNALVERGRLIQFPAAAVVPKELAKATPSDAQLLRMTGLYAANSPARIARISARGHELDLSLFIEGRWGEPTTLVHYNDGRWRQEGDLLTSYWSVTAQGQQYLVKEVPGAVAGHGLKHALQAYPDMQKLEPKAPASRAWTNRGELPAVIVNCAPDAIEMQAPLGLLLQQGPAELSGYVISSDGVPLDASTSDEVARMCLKLPVLFGRDLADLEIVNPSGEELVRMGSYVLRPATAVAALAMGDNTLAIGSEGYAEWRKLPQGARLVTRAATAWILYGESFEQRSAGTGDANLKLEAADAYLVIYGPAGAAVSVSIS